MIEIRTNPRSLNNTKTKSRMSKLIFLILLGALGLLFNGVARITQGAINKQISRWSRGFLIAVGVLSLAISALVMAHPISIGVPLLAITISIALLITGIQMVAVSIGGKPSKQYSQSRVHDMR
jgi:pheromone shutdown protein TraB